MRTWLILAAGLAMTAPAHAFDWNEMLRGVFGQPATQPAAAGVDSLSSTEINAGHAWGLPSVPEECDNSVTQGCGCGMETTVWDPH